MNKIQLLLRGLLSPVARQISPTRWKEFNELYYWRRRKRKEGEFSNRHYRYYYTSHFGLDDDYYKGKTILDIGCGPRGSLEWASMTTRRVGLDPLAKEYLKLGADQHQMEYNNSPSENIPMEDASCDTVFSFNSLDHVDDVGQTLREIKRITRPGGLFLLLVEVNHTPTDCEPHKLTPLELIKSLKPEFAVKAGKFTDGLKAASTNRSMQTARFRIRKPLKKQDGYQHDSDVPKRRNERGNERLLLVRFPLSLRSDTA